MGMKVGNYPESDDGHRATGNNMAQLRALAAIVQCSEDAIISSTTAGVILSWNRGAAIIFGYQEEEMIGQHFSMLAAPEQLSHLAYLAEQISQGVTVSQYESQCRRKDGREFLASISGSPILNDAGEVEALSGILRDISKLKKTEDALVESEERFRVMADGCPTPMWVTDTEGGVYFINRAFREFCGIAHEQAEGRKWELLIYPDDLPQFIRETDRAIRTHTPYHAQARVQRNDGEWRCLVADAAPRFSPDGQFLGHVGLSLDITERKQIEDALREGNESQRRQFADNSVAMLLIDLADERVVEANEAAARFYGYSREQLLKMCVADISTHSRSNIPQILARVSRAGDPPFQSRHRLADGSVRDVEVSTSHIQYAGRTVVHVIVFDITARKRAEEALRESESRHRLLFDGSRDPMMTVNPPSWKFSSGNPAAVELFGARDEVAFTELGPWDVLPERQPDGSLSANRAKEAIDVALREGLHFFDLTHRRVDGTEFHGSVMLTRLEIAGQQFLQATVRDITSQKHTLRALQESEAFLRGITDSAQDAILMMDPRGCITFWNPAAESILGYSSEEVIGKGLHKMLAPERYLASHKAAFPEFLRTGCGNAVGKTVQLAARRKDGREIAIELSLSAVRRNGEWHSVGMVRDITERKLAETRLREVSDRLTLAARAGGVGIWDYNLVTNSLDWDEQMFRLYGITSDQFSGAYEAWQAGLHPEDRERGDEEIQLAIEGKRDFNTEFRVLWMDGSIHYIRALALVKRDANGRPLHVIGTNWDITAQKQAVDDLRESNRGLEEATKRANNLAGEAASASRAKSEFLANMSHEIRTPLNGVMGMTGLLLDTELNAKQRRYAEIVRASGESLLTLINDILDFSKIEAGRLELETLDFNLETLLDDLMAALAVRAHEKGLELLCCIDPAVPRLLRGDLGRLRQILTNLVGNALKFTAKGEVVVRIALQEQEQTECVLRFSITDTGIGIATEKMTALFSRFTQVDASTTRSYGGTGLGLAITKQLAELMGGQAGAASEEGKGSEFWFTARLCQQSDGTGTPSPVPAVLRGVRVLIIDDNATSRKILTTRMLSLGMRPADAEDGHGGLKALYQALQDNDPFRLTLIDRQMPGMDGEAVGRVIKADGRLADTRLVMLSPLESQDDSRRWEQTGFSAYASKPTRCQELIDTLTQALSDRERPQPCSIEHQPVRVLPVSFAGYAARILVAEDNITNQQVAIGILEKLGLRADAVANGVEAISALQAMPYDLVLMDGQMPMMDGFEATRHIRNLQSRVRDHAIPIIAMTALAVQGDRQRCMDAGMDDYVSKPVSPEALAAALALWLRKKNAQSGSLDAAALPPLLPLPSAAPVVFDRAGMLRRLMNNEDLATRVTKTFLGDLPRQIESLQTYLDSRDAPAVGRQAHKIKGASANVGGEALSSVAREIEKASLAGDLISAANGMDELQLEFGRLKDAMTR